MGHPSQDRETPQLAASPGDAVFEPPPSEGGPSVGLATVDSDASQASAAVERSISEPVMSHAPPSPSTRPCSRATTAVPSPGRPRYSLPGATSESAENPEPATVWFLGASARFADLTNVFFSGLIIPLIPTILQARTHVPHGQMQIWTSVLVAAHGGAFALASPLIPFFTRRGSTNYGAFLAGLACAATALALLQFSSDLPLLIVARALQGFAAAATNRASAGILARAASNKPTWCTPAFIQSAAMATGPFIAGLLHDFYNADAVFYCAYALVLLNFLLGLVAARASAALPNRSATSAERDDLLSGTRGGYGTISSPRSSRSTSPTSGRSPRLAEQDASTTAVSWSPRLLVALCGYAVVGLLTSALHGVLPLFVQRHFYWSDFATGHLFVPLSAPAAVIGPLFGLLAARVPRSTRFLTCVGYLVSAHAFLYLGQLIANTTLVQHAFLLTLSILSMATGLSGDPLISEISDALASAGDSWSATAQATSLPNIAHAWGALVGPLLAGAVSWLWGWQTMTNTLSAVSAAACAGSLLFLQGWIGNSYPEDRPRHLDPSFDEESAPLLANEPASRSFYGQSEPYVGKKEGFRNERQNSDDVSPHTRKNRTHRRHFSVDNFSVTTTIGPASMDSSTSSVRFQAALETPVQGPRPATSDSACKASSVERRYVMREAPHAPSTDPFLAAGSLYVIDEERDTSRGVESQRQKRRVVVFPEGSAPPELLERHCHHVVAINALDGTAQMVSESTDNHAVHVTEEAGADEAAFVEGSCRRYVVVVVEGEEYEGA